MSPLAKRGSISSTIKRAFRIWARDYGDEQQKHSLEIKTNPSRDWLLFFEGEGVGQFPKKFPTQQKQLEKIVQGSLWKKSS